MMDIDAEDRKLIYSQDSTGIVLKVKYSSIKLCFLIFIWILHSCYLLWNNNYNPVVISKEEHLV
jgi:hypothetical protein